MLSHDSITASWLKYRIININCCKQHSFNGHFTGQPGQAGNRKAPFYSEWLHFTGANDDGGDGDNWIYKMSKAPVKLSPPTNQHPAFYTPDAFPVAQPTVWKHWREIAVANHAAHSTSCVQWMSSDSWITNLSNCPWAHTWVQKTAYTVSAI